jgi:cytosine deaminase
VCAGGDNIQDPFNLVGRGDPLEAASLLVTAGHVLPDAAVHAVSGAARAVLGLPAVSVAPGSVADLVALPARSAREAVAFAPAQRLVLRAGRVVAGAAPR